MTDQFRAMCKELVDSVELLLEMRAVDAKPMAITEDRVSRARALLAEPVAEGEAEGEVAAWLRLFCSEEYESRYLDPDVAWLTRAAELLEQHHPAPQPVTDPGKVEELVADLNEIAGILCGMEKHRWAVKLTRAAELLEQRHPQPVPVIELPQGWHMLSDIEPEPGAMCDWVTMAPWGCDHGKGKWRDYDGVSPCEFFDVPVGWPVYQKGFASAGAVMVSDPKLTAWRALPLPAGEVGL